MGEEGNLAADEANKSKLRKARKLSDEDQNPCLKETQMSHKCMSDNDYNKDKCVLYFENYRNCMKFWRTIAGERRQNGLKPYMPLAVDRSKIKEDYLNKRAGKT